MNSIKVKVLSEGIAIGHVQKLKFKVSNQTATEPNEEKEKLVLSIQKSIKEIEELKKTHQENEEYLAMQILLLSDSVLLNKASKEIEQGASAMDAISLVLGDYMNSLLDATSDYLKERVLDLSDVKERILKNLSGRRNEKYTKPFILIAEELYPSFLIQNRTMLLGVITKKGGYSSHSAILCRQFHIPYVIAESPIDSAFLIIDSRKQQIITDPSQEEIEEYEEILKKLSQETYEAVPHNPLQFLANVSDNSDLKKVVQYGFDGIGLYRTEMIFMHNNRPLSLEEQFEIYSEAVEVMQEKKICFRTFDIGDDKQLSYLKAHQKGVENYIHNPVLFKTQIEALLKANRYNSIKLLFPMIYSASEFSLLKRWVLQIQKEIRDISFVEFGIMLETKEALEQIETFTEVDFISIGTNDLVLDIFHIHRDDQTDVLNKYLNNLLGKLKKVVEFCEKNQIMLSVCGELAAIGSALREFIKIGIQNYSVAPSAIKVLNHIYKEFY